MLTLTQPNQNQNQNQNENKHEMNKSETNFPDLNCPNDCIIPWLSLPSPKWGPMRYTHSKLGFEEWRNCNNTIFNAFSHLNWFDPWVLIRLNTFLYFVTIRTLTKKISWNRINDNLCSRKCIHSTKNPLITLFMHSNSFSRFQHHVRRQCRVRLLDHHPHGKCWLFFRLLSFLLSSGFHHW